jgi:4-oxalocrotonate tautomerase
MPFIHVQMLAGRTAEQKSVFMKEVAAIAQRTLRVPEHAVTIIINEVESDHWSVGLRTMKDIRSTGVSD